jgi:indole-3-glycerol phosphate synthase
VQASRAWTAPAGTLGGIVTEAYARAEALAPRADELAELARVAPPAPALSTALQRDTVGVIAEVKRRSPSKGWINPGIAAAGQAAAYARGGAAAISVLTEPRHFGGSLDDLRDVRRAVELPVIKKDFHVSTVQLLEARATGASAALLIARALPPADLRRLVEFAREIALEVLVEVRDEEELSDALELGARLIGINNRNLESLAIDPATSERLLGMVPAGVVAVAESGVSSRNDVERVARRGADAVLVGSTISAADDPAAAVRALSGVPKVTRAG